MGVIHGEPEVHKKLIPQFPNQSVSTTVILLPMCLPCLEVAKNFETMCLLVFLSLD